MNGNAEGGAAQTIYLAIPSSLYENTFELRTGDYPIRIQTVAAGISGFQVLSAGTVEADKDVTIRIARL